MVGLCTNAVKDGQGLEAEHLCSSSSDGGTGWKVTESSPGLCSSQADDCADTVTGEDIWNGPHSQRRVGVSDVFAQTCRL